MGILEDSGSKKSGTNDFQLVGAALSAFSVAIMSAAFLLMRNSRRLRILYQGGERSDWVTLIAGLSGIERIRDLVCFTEHDISYGRLADLFLISASGGADAETRKRSILGLYAILLCQQVHRTSTERVRQNLNHLGESISDSEFSSRLDRAKKLTHQQQREEILALLT